MKTGLVLGGGGAKGCYEIGAIEAFKECNRHFDCVAGTSIGAIVGAMYVTENIESLVDFVLNLKPDAIVENLVVPENIEDVFEHSESLRKVAWHYQKEGGVDITPLKNKFKEIFNYEQFAESKMDFACMTYNVTELRAVPWFKSSLTKDNIEDVIIASASCFPAFPMQKIGEDSYIDGGYDDNLPVDLALIMGAENIIAIDVKGVGIYKPKIDTSNITYWQPLVPLGNFLDFRSKEGIRSMILGYLETMKRLGMNPGFIYTFKKENLIRMIKFEEFAKDYFKKVNASANESIKHKIVGIEICEFKTKYTDLFLYEILLEYLAYAAGVNPANFMDFNDFLEIVLETLNFKKTEDRMNILEFNYLWDYRIFEFIKLLYKDKNPDLYKTIKEIDFFDDYFDLATIWKCLDEFMKL